MSNLAAQELQSFVRRIENLDDEIRALNADKSEVFKEVKSAGFTAKTLRKVVAARRMDATERDDADAEFELYWNAVHGIEIDHVRAHVDVHAREAALLAAEQKREPVDWDEVSRREFPDDSPVQVYFIEAPSLGLIKIGSTGMLDRRVAAIKRGTPVPTELIGVIGGGTKREVELHKKFAAQRVHGEWFAEVIRPELDLLLAGQPTIEEFDAETGEITEQPSIVARAAEDEDHDSNAVATVPTTQDGNANTGGQNESAAHPELVNLDRRPGPTASDVGQNGSEHQRSVHSETNKAPAGRVADESPAPTNITTIRPTKPMRPHCLKPEACGGQGRNHCWSCTKAMTQSGEVA